MRFINALRAEVLNKNTSGAPLFWHCKIRFLFNNFIDFNIEFDWNFYYYRNSIQLIFLLNSIVFMLILFEFIRKITNKLRFERGKVKLNSVASGAPADNQLWKNHRRAFEKTENIRRFALLFTLTKTIKSRLKLIVFADLEKSILTTDFVLCIVFLREGAVCEIV
jgi:hypothetical protein